MGNCRMIEKALASGKFNETLSSIPKALETHLDECTECRAAHERLIAVEALLNREEPVELSMTERARIRIGVLNGMNTRKEGFAIWFRPVWGILATGIIAAVMILQPWYRPVQAPQEQLAVQDGELVELMLDYIEEPIAYDDENIELALIEQSDSELIAMALDSFYWSSLQEYDESMMAGISELDDDGWDDLRRYLI